MKLAVVGVLTVGFGVALGIPGLIGIGAWWIPTGLLVRAHGQRLRDAQGDSGRAGVGSVAQVSSEVRALDGKTFAVGTVLLLAVGLPSLAVGILELGIDPEDASWRWLPIAIGALTTGIALVSGLMYAAGAGLSAAADAAGVPEVPATVWIRSLKETGTFVNERPRLEFELSVEPDESSGVAPYEVTKKATVPFTAMASLRVGDGFEALVVGPEKPTAMTIDWDAPVTGSGDVGSRLEALEQLRRDAKISDAEYDAQRQRILGSL
jgi:hypothetical protein